MTQRLLSLAAGNLPEFSPVDVAIAAAATGWPAAGIWFDADTWSARTTKDVRDVYESHTLTPLDIEVIWIHPGAADPDHERLLAAGAEIGAQNALIVSSEPNLENTKRRFDALCRTAESFGLNACLEFLPITEIKTLEQALDVIESVQHPRGKLLLDTLHLIRSGGSISGISKIPLEYLTYAQPCDAPAALPQQGDNPLLLDAVDGRQLLGEGGLPLRQFIQALPADLPLSPEIRSRALRERYPEAAERAAAILHNTHRYLDSLASGSEISNSD